MPDIIITPGSGKLEFVEVSAQATRKHSFTLDANDGLNLDSPLSAAAISAPLNVINVTVNNSNANYPFVLAQSGETGAKNLLMDGAGGTYNPFTNTATIDISGNAATATNASQLNGQSSTYYQTALGYTPVNKAGDTITGNLVVNGNFSVNGSVIAFTGSNVYITSSQLVIDDNIITLNAFSPFLRYTGIEMIDSGSATTSSILWDSQNDYFFLTGSGTNGKIIVGPDQQGNLTSTKIPKATGTNILGDSIITDNGSSISIGGSITATNLSGTNTGDQTVGDATLTVAAGTGISLSASPSFTANAITNKTITVSNSGVTAITTNTGLSTNASATGAVTITNTGVTSAAAGTGISVDVATGAVTITNSSPNATHTGDVTGATSLTIAANAVTTAKIADANVTYAKIQNLTTSRVLGRISAGAGVVQELAGNDIVTIIGSNTVTSASYALLSSTVTTNANLTGDVTSVGNATTIANNAVTTVKILDANVTAAKLAADAVTTIKILDANVTAAKLAADSVITTKILDANVTTGKLADNAVTTAKITDANVTYAKIQNVAISSVLGNSNSSTAQAPGAINMTTLAAMLSGKTMDIVGTATTASYANSLNTANSYTGVNFTATGFFQTNLGQIKSDTSFALLTTGNGAQTVSAKGILLGTSYDTTPNANEIRSTNNTNLIFNSRGTGQIDLYTNDTSKVTLLNNGNFGIGNTNPLAKLHVAGTTGLYQSAGNTYLYYDHSGVNTWRTGIFTDNTSTYIIGHDSGGTFATKIFAISMAGNVGIGTTLPSTKLHINSTTSGDTLLRTDGTNGTLFSVVDDLSDSLLSVNNSAGLPVLEVFADDRVVAGQYGKNDFVVVNNKIGIGTNNPGYKLDVSGSVYITSTAVFPNTSNAGLSTVDGTALLRLDDTNGNIYLLNNAGGFYVDATSHNFRNASSAVLMTISNAGDVTATRYILGTYVNTSDNVPNSENITYIMAKFGDNYYRSATAAKVAGFISGQAMNISGTATSAATWTTPRTLTIGSTGKSVNGGADVSWTLAELGAAATNQTMYIGTTAVAINRSSAALTLNGVSIDGNSATATTSAQLTTSDVRTLAPSSANALRLTYGFTSWTNDNNSPYADYLHLRSYSDSSGGSDNLVMFRKNAIGMRIWQQTFGSSTSYSNYKDVAFTDQTFYIGTTSIAINRASSAQTLNGVSIDGNAATVTTNANLTGDVTSVGNATTIASNAVTTAKITNSNVTYAKIQNVSATSKVLGRISSGAGVIEELSGADIATVIGTSAVTNATNAATATNSTQLGGVGAANYVRNDVDGTDSTALFRLTTFTKSLTVTTSWSDTGISGTDLASGAYILTLNVDNYTVGGGHYNETYAGIMYWYSGGTNDTGVDEIPLHKSGHAPNGRYINLRTVRQSSGGTNLKLQIISSVTTSGAVNYVFKFRRMI